MQSTGEREALWRQRGVIYQVYPRSFQDSGYDVSGYVDVDPIFGTLADFDAMLAAAHERGLKVIVDYVPNHTSDQHPWFVEARASHDSPKRDWYVFRDPKPDGSPPNNWLAAFGGPSWTLDEATGQHYLHSFLPQQPDVNWRNPELKAAMFDVLRFWLDRGVDGFRFDVAPSVMKDPELRDNPMRSPDQRGSTHKPMGEIDDQILLHNRMHPDIHGLYREIRSLLDDHSAEQPRYLVGETHIFEPEEWASLYGAALDEMHQPGNFGLLKVDWTAADIRAHVDTIDTATPEGAWPNYVLSNHDEHRTATRVGPAQARNAMLLLLTLRGTQTLYYGEELGMENVPISPEQERDPWGLRVPGLGLGRDPERTPMRWDASENAGFAEPGVEPWLPLGDDAATLNVAVERQRPGSMLSMTKRLLELRDAHPALASGDYAPVEGTDDAVFAFLRSYDDERFLIAINTTAEAASLSLPNVGVGEVVLGTMMARSGELDLTGIDLGPNEGIVVRLEGTIAAR